MYVALIVLLAVLALGAIGSGVRRKRPWRIAAGCLILVATGLFFALLSFWGEMLWFESLGFGRRFWTVVLSVAGFALMGIIAGGTVVFVLTLPVRRTRARAVRLATVAGAALGGIWGAKSWDLILKWWNGVAAGVTDPILGKDAGFYLFVLPFLDRLWLLLLALSALSLIFSLPMAASAAVRRRPRIRIEWARAGSESRAAAGLCLAALLLVVAWRQLLGIYHLMYSTWGAVTGAGWTDVVIRIPAYRIVAVIAALAAVALLASGFARRSQAAGPRPSQGGGLLVSLPLSVLAAWFIGLVAVPGLVQWLRVVPNEITFEKPFIENNIRFTRLGFGLHDVEERDYPVSAALSQETLDRNRHLISEVRLWDWRALKAVHKQFQEIRLYYEFNDVDIDRYTLGDSYRQVMVSAREMELANLPRQSRTFVNERFKYTHGYGVTMTPVSEFTPEGLPNFLTKDIPPRTNHPELQLEYPQIYYGELTDTPVFVNTSEAEFDYPKGDQNVYSRYAGTGDVQLSGFWRRFVFGWKFDGTRFLLSGYPTPDSRVLFHRQVSERVKRIAPFLKMDDDPYVIVDRGKLYWMVDAYTTSSRFPYSAPFSSRETIEFADGAPRRIVSRVSTELDGANYVRNSVKAVVDAYEGKVTLYVFEPDDPIIRVWQRIFPDLFRPKTEMPEGLLRHIRYPGDLLLAQGIVYAKYHMSDPAVFYNQEDLWVRATEKYYAGVQPVEPYYVMWELPGAPSAEFVQILPFTPKNRQVLIGWIAGMCDPAHYGRLLAYKFPKEERILGPQQVETKIDQDKFLSGQLTLWDQRGSKVIRGNVLAIPIEDTVLYVEPIYLQAETAAYPELRLVATMHGDRLSYAETFAEALRGLLAGTAAPALQSAALPAPALGTEARKALEAFHNYLRLLGEQRFAEAAAELESLRRSLMQMAGETAPR